jgi:predicted methyltransferase
MSPLSRPALPLLLALLLPHAAAAQDAPAPSPAIAAALADPARPQAERDRDSARHAAELLALAEVAPGKKVADFIMGGGYWSRILARAVGPQGHVYAYQPAEFIQFSPDYGTQQKAVAAAYPGVLTASSDSLAAFRFPEPLDLVLTVQNWHDLHLKQAPAGFAGEVARRLFAALKPGGVLLVVDHVATADPAMTAPETLHRIDPAAARREIEAAGFVLEAQSPLLADPADPHSASVFDPAIRGRTDQFVFKFRKPRG